MPRQWIQRVLAAGTLIAALASCGAEGQPASFALRSDAFAPGQPIPAPYGCDGVGRSPPLRWSGPPKGTRGFALVLDDPDAPGGTFRHWAAYNIPAALRALSAGQEMGPEVINDFGRPGYGSPCPPKGHGPHHYRFTLYALDVDGLGVPAGSNVADVAAEARKHAFGQAELIGTYERK